MGRGVILSLCQGQFKGHGYREVERTGTGNISPKRSRSAGSLVTVCGQGELEASHQDSKGNKAFEMLSLLCDKFAKLFYICCTIGALSHSVRFTWKSYYVFCEVSKWRLREANSGAGSPVCKWQKKDSNPGSWLQTKGFFCFILLLSPWWCLQFWLYCFSGGTETTDMKSIDVKLGGDSGDVPSPGVVCRCALISPQRPGQWCKRAGIIHGPCPIHKTNSKWIIYRNGKLLEETIGENPGNL